MLKRSNAEFFCRRSPLLNAVEVWAQDGDAVFEQVILTTKHEGEMRDPFMAITMESAQKLMDELWHCGIRPTEGAGSAGAMAAVQRHLEDMRTLVFEEPKVTKIREPI